MPVGVDELEEVIAGVKRALKEAREAIGLMVERGEYGAAIKAIVGVIDGAFAHFGEALRPLAESTADLGRSISELRDRTADLERSIRELRESTANLERSVAELRKSTAELEHSIRELRDRTAELERGARELKDRTSELERGARALYRSLEREAELRRRLEGDVGRLRGYLLESLLGERLAHWCVKHGLGLEYLQREYRANAAITGERLVALVQMAEVGEERDVEQLLEGAKAYERREGVKPHALVLYVRTIEPPEGVVRLCEEHGIVLESSPKSIARKLAELDKKLGMELR